MLNKFTIPSAVGAVMVELRLRVRTLDQLRVMVQDRSMILCCGDTRCMTKGGEQRTIARYKGASGHKGQCRIGMLMWYKDKT